MGPAAEYKNNMRGISQSFELRVDSGQDVHVSGSDSTPTAPAANDYCVVDDAVVLRNSKYDGFEIQNVGGRAGECRRKRDVGQA